VVGWPVEINGTQSSFLSSTTIFHRSCACTMFASLSSFYCGERIPQGTKIFHIFSYFPYILKIYPVVKSGNPAGRPNNFTVDWRCTILGLEVAPTTNFRQVASYILASTIWNSFHVTILSPTILRRFQDFREKKCCIVKAVIHVIQRYLDKRRQFIP